MSHQGGGDFFGGNNIVCDHVIMLNSFPSVSASPPTPQLFMLLDILFPTFYLSCTSLPLPFPPPLPYYLTSLCSQNLFSLQHHLLSSHWWGWQFCFLEKAMLIMAWQKILLAWTLKLAFNASELHFNIRSQGFRLQDRVFNSGDAQ